MGQSLLPFSKSLLVALFRLTYSVDASFKRKREGRPWLERGVQKNFLKSMHILVISANERLTGDLQSRAEGAGFTVLFSSSLERSFLEANSVVPFLVVVDDEAIPDELWQAKQFLSWFRRRSPVFLLSNDGSEGLEKDCDRCFPKSD